MLDAIVTNLRNIKSQESQAGNQKQLAKSGILTWSHSFRLLNFLACLVSHPSIKSSVLHLMMKGNTTKSDDAYQSLITSLSAILVMPSSSPTHIQAQECVIAIMQSLCDTEISLIPAPMITNTEVFGNGLSSVQDSFLSNAVPSKEILIPICTALLDHVAESENNFQTLLPIMRTFILITEHDYGFFHLKSCLEKNQDAFWNLFIKFCMNFGKDNTDLLATLSACLELLRMFITLDEDETSLGVMPRTLAMTVPELASAVGWKRVESPGIHENSIEESERASKDMILIGIKELGSGDSPGSLFTKKHPIVVLEKLLQECISEEDSLESLYENVSGLVRLLEEDGVKSNETKECLEPILPPPESLLVQFAARPAFVIGESDDDRLSSNYWLSSLIPDEQEQEIEQVNCDIMDVCRTFLPEFHLPFEAEKLCRSKDVTSNSVDLEKMKKRDGEINKYLASNSKNKRPFVAPMRGRGFGRSMPQRGDLFRSRPPNTSRPPSLHVDDFVALEISGQQPTGPTGYNKISMRAAKEIISVRARGGRGRSFVPERGRFFSSSSPYPRRENGRGMQHGIGSMIPRINNGRGGIPPGWSPHGGDCSNQPQQQQQRSFRSTDNRDMHMLPRTDDFSAGRFGRGGMRGSNPWIVKDNRERFGGPNVRGGRNNRHLHSFTR